MLRVNHLSVAIKTTALLKDLSFSIAPKETVVLLGPNGAGKSTLASSIMGNPKYKIVSGTIEFNGENITNLPQDARARKKIFQSHQSPVEISGISTAELLHTVLDETEKLSTEDFERRLGTALKTLNLSPFFKDRDLNVGFSGGERKKNEILQLLVLRPKLALLDEIDSGLDLDATKIIAKALKSYQEETGCSYLIITHNFRLLNELPISRVLLLEDGRLEKTGDRALLEKIKTHGFKGL